MLLTLIDSLRKKYLTLEPFLEINSVKTILQN